MRKVLTRARRHWRLRSATALAAVGALVLGAGAVLVATPAAADGNNGTLKVLDATSGVELVNTEPHVCLFRFEGFGFDDGQTGSVWVNGQPPGPVGFEANLGTVKAQDGPDIDGYFVTGTHALRTGHYKVAFRDATGDELKSKVFWVDCEQPGPVTERVSDSVMNCEVGYGTRTGLVTKEYVWSDSAGWVLEPEPGWTYEWGAWSYRPLTNDEFVRLGCRPSQPDPVTRTLSDQRMSCDLGVEARPGTQTTTYVWNASTKQYDAVTGAVSWGAWTFVRDLTDAEYEALDCRPDQPEPVVEELTDERMGCDIGVEEREGTQTTSYVWNAQARAYDTVVGPEVWGDWVTVRDLTTEEFIDLDCVAGEETVVPKPEPTPEVDNPDREPVVLGTEASVPRAVAAGLGGETAATTSQLVGEGLMGAGFLALVAAGGLGLARRTRGAHEG